MQDDCRIFGNGKSSKTTNKNQHHKFPSGLGYLKPEGKNEGESYTLFRTLPSRLFSGGCCPFFLRLIPFSTHVADFAQKVVGFLAKTDKFSAKVHKF